MAEEKATGKPDSGSGQPKSKVRFFLDGIDREALDLWDVAKKWTKNEVPDKVLGFEVPNRVEAIRFFLGRLKALAFPDEEERRLEAQRLQLRAAREKRLSDKEARLAKGQSVATRPAPSSLS